MAKKQKVAKRRQSEVIEELSKVTEVPKAQVKAVLVAQAELATADVRNKKLGAFSFPYLPLSLKRVHKPATKERKGTNPFTGEATTFKAKPARTVVKAVVRKKLKEAAA